MRVRHKIPSIFSLSMVDVMCCALGCVILLWLLNLREAKEHEDDAAQQLQAAAARGADLEGQRRSLADEKSDLERRLAAARAAATDLRAELKREQVRLAALEVDVRAREKRVVDLTGKLRDTQRTADMVPGLRKDLDAARSRYANEETRAQGLTKKLSARERALEQAEKELKDTAEVRATLTRDLKSRARDLADAQARADRLERELAAANRGAARVRAEAARVRAAAESRFAGITLTGRRVVFLVDMSYSMRLVDEKTPAPTKWTEVRNTVARLMKSLPDLEKFQVVVFAEKARYLLGSDGQWLDYEEGTSIDRVVKGLAETAPKGGTNMYAALEAAFRLRGDGLDAVYLLSDGLPNLGEGLPPGSETLGEFDRSARLAHFVRNKLKTDWNRRDTGRPRIRINTVGFFYESPDVGAFLWALARENDGSFVGMSNP